MRIQSILMAAAINLKRLATALALIFATLHFQKDFPTHEAIGATLAAKAIRRTISPPRYA